MKLTLFVVSVQRIVCGEVQATALLALQGPAGNKVAHVNHVAQFADVAGGTDALKEAFRLFVEHVQTVPGPVQAQVAADDAHVVGHNLVDLLDTLGNQHLLLVGHGSLVVPFWYPFVEVVQVDVCQGVLGGSVGIDDGLDERVGSQTVAAVQTGA